MNFRLPNRGCLGVALFLLSFMCACEDKFTALENYPPNSMVKAGEFNISCFNQTSLKGILYHKRMTTNQFEDSTYAYTQDSAFVQFFNSGTFDFQDSILVVLAGYQGTPAPDNQKLYTSKTIKKNMPVGDTSGLIYLPFQQGNISSGYAYEAFIINTTTQILPVHAQRGIYNGNIKIYGDTSDSVLVGTTPCYGFIALDGTFRFSYTHAGNRQIRGVLTNDTTLTANTYNGQGQALYPLVKKTFSPSGNQINIKLVTPTTTDSVYSFNIQITKP